MSIVVSDVSVSSVVGRVGCGLLGLLAGGAGLMGDVLLGWGVTGLIPGEVLPGVVEVGDTDEFPGLTVGLSEGPLEVGDTVAPVGSMVVEGLPVPLG